MKVLTAEQIRRSEAAAVMNGSFSFRELMAIAGTSAADRINNALPVKGKEIVLLCGSGNNGGDGFVAAARLKELGAHVSVLLPLGEPVTEDAKYYFSLLAPEDIVSSLPKKIDVVVDALFGIGLNRPLSDEICRLINTVNGITAFKVSIDIPSGAVADGGNIMSTCFRADITLTFIALKPCFLLPAASDYCGDVQVIDIGVKPLDFEFQTIEKPMMKKRRHNAHKGDFGTGLIICGSYGMAGAAILASKAALRAGLGIAKCVICEGIYQGFTAALPEAVCIPSKQNEKGQLSGDTHIPSLLQGANALLFGCGVGVSDDTGKLLKSILENTQIPTVIDADGINLLADSIELLKNCKAPVILTPHPGEMARLCKRSVAEIEASRVEFARNFAVTHGIYIALKGGNTILCDPEGNILFNTTGNPGMATGGSGDLLSGIILSLLAQGLSPKEALASALYIHGEAGDKAAAKRGQAAIIPSDIIEEL